MKALFTIAALSILTVARVGAADPLRVASFSTITTEIVEKVGGGGVKVTALVKPGIDPHDYEPKPDDLREVGDAQLILASGKNMENYTAKLKESAAPNAVLLAVGDEFPSLTMKAGSSGKEMIPDPHWWHSIANMKRATLVIRDALIRLAPADQSAFSVNAVAYMSSLDELQRWARSKIAELPRDRRKLVTSHDAFQYFARDYGFAVYPIEGVSTEDEASSKKIAGLVQTIKDQHVKAVFFENIENPKVLKEITAETGARGDGELYADGLGEGEAGTYDGMFRHNVTTIVEELK